MLDDFLHFVKKSNLFTAEQKVLLATSGGIDSVVMCHLFHQAKLPFGIAHCNFTLREEVSDEDEHFVEALADHLNVPFYCIRFSTASTAQNRKQSIQEVARDLRYEWLEKVRMENNYDFIATAHHLNDSIETALFNFGRGSGIRGLHGIQAKVGNIIRPMLFAIKMDIEKSAQEQVLNWRNDASNDSDKYSRNKIRHHIIPAFQEIYPSFEQKAGETIKRIQAVEQIFDWSIAHFKEKIYSETEGNIQIDLKKLLSLPASSTILFELIKEFGFHGNQMEKILRSGTGRQFSSSTHELLIDRNTLIIRKINQFKETNFLIEANTKTFALEGTQFDIQTINELPNPFPKDSTIAYFDYEKLSFPLKLRHWQEGDRFQPLGMQGKSKKVQDLFSDLKLNRFEKEKVWLLESGSEISWVVGYRLDERFKVTQETKQLFVITKKDFV